MNLIGWTIDHQIKDVNALGIVWRCLQGAVKAGLGRGLFFRSKGSRPAHFKELWTGDARPLRLTARDLAGLPPPSLFPSPSLGAIGSPVP